MTEVLTDTSEEMKAIPIPALRKGIGGGIKKQEILRLLGDPIRDEITRLFLVEGLPSHMIEERINRRLNLPGYLAITTKWQIVREVINHTLTKDEIYAVVKKQKQKIYDERAYLPAIRANRDYKRNNGEVVFSDEEFTYLLKIRGQKRASKGTMRCDNEIIAKAMNDRFLTNRFTTLNCRQKFANYNCNKSKREKEGIRESRRTPISVEENSPNVDHYIVSTIKWTMLSAEMEMISVNQDQLSNAVHTLDRYLTKGVWKTAIRVIHAMYSKFSPDVQHVLDFVSACCYLEMSKFDDAETYFRFCARYKGGPMIEKIKHAREALPSVEGSSILYNIGKSTAISALSLIETEE